MSMVVAVESTHLIFPGAVGGISPGDVELLELLPLDDELWLESELWLELLESELELWLELLSLLELLEPELELELMLLELLTLLELELPLDELDELLLDPELELLPLELLLLELDGNVNPDPAKAKPPTTSSITVPVIGYAAENPGLETLSTSPPLVSNIHNLPLASYAMAVGISELSPGSIECNPVYGNGTLVNLVFALGTGPIATTKSKLDGSIAQARIPALLGFAILPRNVLTPVAMSTSAILTAGVNPLDGMTTEPGVRT